MDSTKSNTEKDLVPKPVLGEQSGAQADKECKTEEEAKHLFNSAKEKLFNINDWHKFAGPGSAEFDLTDKAGNPKTGMPQIGDHIKIDLPGPGTSEGDGYDWVVIEAIDDRKDSMDEYAAIRVRPCPNPKTPGDDKIAHFHAETATSTFLVQRQGNIISAAEKGRNELQNKNNNLGFWDKLRNIITSFSASRGAAWPQWKALMEGFLEEKK